MEQTKSDTGLIRVERPLGPPGKLKGYDFYHQVLKSAKYVVAPMVDQSELAWRLLSRRYGADLCYTPMIHSRVFLDVYKACGNTFAGQCDQFELQHVKDAPLIAQFCGNDPQTFVEAVSIYLKHVPAQAIDLNLGCPQGIAKKGYYGAFLMDDLDLVERIVSTLDREVSVPITVKIRVFDDVEKTLAYVKMLERAGAQLITVHGRVREQKGCLTGVADWEIIKRVKEAVSIPVFANGNILYFNDALECLKATGCDGVMSAEGNLYNPTIYSQNRQSLNFLNFCQIPEIRKVLGSREDLDLLFEHPPAHLLALEYLDICVELMRVSDATEHSLRLSAVRGHMFKLLRNLLTKYPNHRSRIGKATIKDIPEIVSDLGLLVEQHIMSNPLELDCLNSNHVKILPKTNEGVEIFGGYFRSLPFWASQPYIRPPMDNDENSNATVKNGDIAKQRAEAKIAREKRKLEAKERFLARKKQIVLCKSCHTPPSLKCPHGLCKDCCRKFVRVEINKYLEKPADSFVVEHELSQLPELLMQKLYCKPHSTKEWKIKN